MVIAIQHAGADDGLEEELTALVYPVLHGKMDPEHWCMAMQSDRGIPVRACILYLWSKHAIWVNEWAVASARWAAGEE